jgi:hypothetical protein
MTGLHNVHGISRVKHSPQHLPDTITPRDLLTSSHVYHCGFFDTFSFWRTLPKPPTTLRSERISGGYFGHHDFGRWHPRFFRCWLYRRSDRLAFRWRVLSGSLLTTLGLAGLTLSWVWGLILLSGFITGIGTAVY